MSETEKPNDRPQDVGRSHTRRTELDVAAAGILETYRHAIELELDELLRELWPSTGQLTLVGSVERPLLAERRLLWALAVKLAHELETAPASTQSGNVPGPGRAQPAPAFTVAQRRALGQAGR